MKNQCYDIVSKVDGIPNFKITDDQDEDIHVDAEDIIKLEELINKAPETMILEQMLLDSEIKLDPKIKKVDEKLKVNLDNEEKMQLEFLYREYTGTI